MYWDRVINYAMKKRRGFNLYKANNILMKSMIEWPFTSPVLTRAMPLRNISSGHFISSNYIASEKKNNSSSYFDKANKDAITSCQSGSMG